MGEQGQGRDRMKSEGYYCEAGNTFGPRPENIFVFVQATGLSHAKQRVRELLQREGLYLTAGVEDRTRRVPDSLVLAWEEHA